MSRNSLLVIIVILFTLTVTSFGQVTENPSVEISNPSNARIKKIELTADATNVTVEYTKTEKDSKQAWVSFNSSTYIRPKGGFVSYHVQRLADNKELDKKYPTIDSIGTKYIFVLIFPKLEAGVEYIDIIEPNGWRWENITIKNPKISPATIEPTAVKDEKAPQPDSKVDPIPSEPKSEPVAFDKGAVAKAEAEYLKALIDSDAGSLERLVSSSFSYGNENKSSFISTTLEVDFLTYETSGVEFDLQNGVANVSGKFLSERKAEGERLLFEGNFKRTWRFEDKQWRLTSTINTDVIDRYAKRTPVSEMESLAKTLKPKKSIRFRYDKFDDFSAVETDPYNLVSGMESFVANAAVGVAQQQGNYGDTKNIITDVYFRAGVGFKGTTMVGRPRGYLLYFVTAATTWKLLGEDKTLYFIIDEDRLKLEPADNPDTDIEANRTSGVRTYESIGYWITAKDLARIVKAKSVELRLGSTKPRKMKQELQNRIGNLLIVTGNESLIAPKP